MANKFQSAIQVEYVRKGMCLHFLQNVLSSAINCTFLKLILAILRLLYDNVEPFSYTYSQSHALNNEVVQCAQDELANYLCSPYIHIFRVTISVSCLML